MNFSPRVTAYFILIWDKYVVIDVVIKVKLFYVHMGVYSRACYTIVHIHAGEYRLLRMGLNVSQEDKIAYVSLAWYPSIGEKNRLSDWLELNNYWVKCL